MREELLRQRLDELYRQYDHRFVTPDPLEFVRAQETDADREVVGLLASSLAFGTVTQIKASIARVLAVLGPRPADAVRSLAPAAVARDLSAFKHRWSDGRDVACLLHFMRQMLEASGSIEGFFARGLGEGADVEGALQSFSARALALDHAGLYGRGRLPARAGVRYFFPSPVQGSACKRLNLYLRWMVRRDDGVDLGVWRSVDPKALVIPLDAHIFAISRRVRLTKYKSAGWPMARDITRRLRRLDPADPVKYDFALHRMGLFKKADEIQSLRG